MYLSLVGIMSISLLQVPQKTTNNNNNKHNSSSNNNSKTKNPKKQNQPTKKPQQQNHSTPGNYFFSCERTVKSINHLQKVYSLHKYDFSLWNKYLQRRVISLLILKAYKNITFFVAKDNG